MTATDIFDKIRGNYGLSNTAAAKLAQDLAEQLSKKICPECGEEFIPTIEWQDVCSRDCHHSRLGSADQF